MKFLGGLVVGLIIGIVGMYVGPSTLLATAKLHGGQAVEAAKSEKYDLCRRKFYDDTKCLQFKGQLECGQELVNECGDNPDTKGSEK